MKKLESWEIWLLQILIQGRIDQLKEDEISKLQKQDYERLQEKLENL